MGLEEGYVWGVRGFGRPQPRKNFRGDEDHSERSHISCGELLGGASLGNTKGICTEGVTARRKRKATLKVGHVERRTIPAVHGAWEGGGKEKRMAVGEQMNESRPNFKSAARSS